jgi:deoxyadenosine/deoxycytidine kinase
MGKLITVVGNTGVGKTTLVRLLSEQAGFVTGLEGYTEHPFQALFKSDPNYALANQLDYLLLRAEQEQAIRNGPQTGVLDGGLDMDFHVFTRLFHQKGWLRGDELNLLERLYASLRNLLPPPEVIIYMQANAETVAERFRHRGRILEVATLADVQVAGDLLDRWLGQVDPERVLHFDASADDPTYRLSLPNLLVQINTKIGTAQWNTKSSSARS